MYISSDVWGTTTRQIILCCTGRASLHLNASIVASCASNNEHAQLLPTCAAGRTDPGTPLCASCMAQSCKCSMHSDCGLLCSSREESTYQECKRRDWECDGHLHSRHLCTQWPPIGALFIITGDECQRPTAAARRLTTGHIGHNDKARARG